MGTGAERHVTGVSSAGALSPLLERMLLDLLLSLHSSASLRLLIPQNVEPASSILVVCGLQRSVWELKL